MKFKTKRDGKLWCEVANDLAFKVDLVAIRCEQRLWKTGDLRLRKLSKLLHTLSKQFRAGLIEGMKEIEAEDEQ